MYIFVARFSLAGLIAIQAVRRRREGAVGSTLLESIPGIHRLLPGRARDHENIRYGR